MYNNASPRYSLILETVDGNRYYFNANVGAFIKLYDEDKIVKTSLPKLDFLTANFTNKYDLATSYGIEEKIQSIYITYNFQGEKKLAPVFNNSKWAHITSTYTKGGLVDFKDKDNLDAYNEVYSEISDLNSQFSDILIKNKKKLINLSPNTINTILALRAHKCATLAKKTYGFPTNYETYDAVSRVYSEDGYGFYQDLKKQLSRYREFRTVYLNYCKYKNIQESNQLKEEDKPKKKVIVPDHQISMFDQPWE